MAKVTEVVAALAAPVVEEHGCTLWDVEYVKEAGEWFLRLYIDKAEGVSINDCEAIMDYENNVFFEILAEDLARRDMDDVPIDESNYDELTRRIDAYIDEFERNGTDNIVVESEP